MSNLGWYQIMTTAAKKVGGPKALCGIVAVGGYGLFRALEAGVKAIVTKKKDSSEDLTSHVYEFTDDVFNPVSISFYKGEKYVILDTVDDGFLISLTNGRCNPYVVSKETLVKHSTYRG